MNPTISLISLCLAYGNNTPLRKKKQLIFRVDLQVVEKEREIVSMKPMMEFEVQTGDAANHVYKNVRVLFFRYPADNALGLYVRSSSGDFAARLTAYLDSPWLAPDETYIDIPSYPNALDFLQKYGIAEPLPSRIKNGAVEYKLAKFHLRQMGIRQFVVQKECPLCIKNQEHTYHYIRLNPEQAGRYHEFALGHGRVGDIFPELNPLEHTFLVSGMCPKCQTEMYKTNFRSDILCEGIWLQEAWEDEANA